MIIIITGIAGLIGSRLADWILKNIPNVKIIGIDDLSGGYQENIPKEVIFYKQDAASDSVNDIFEVHKPDYVYAMASYAAEGLSPFIRKFNYQNNLITTANIINCCINHNVKRLVFTSSMSVYGEGTPPFDETVQQRPIDPYGISKYACEQDIRVAGEQHGLDWCVIRPHNVYGINQNHRDRYRNVLGIWMYNHLNNLPLTIYGDGEQKRAFSYIDDCLEPLWKAVVDKKTSKEIINLGGMTEYTINEAADILIEVMGGGTKVYLEPRHEVKYAYSTYEKSITHLGYEDRMSLKAGLAKMWEWAKEQPMRNRMIWDKYEVEKGIYEYWKIKNGK